MYILFLFTYYFYFGVDLFTNVIAVNGGKGGTGKTFVSVNLAIYLKQLGFNVLLIDSDVENPNSNIILGAPKIEDDGNTIKKQVFQYIPRIDEELCTKCGKCSAVCRMHAIFHVKTNYPILMENLCSGCKLCERVCPEAAIKSNSKMIGETIYKEKIKSGNNGSLDLLLGVLKIGQVRAANVVEELFELTEELVEKNNYDYIVLDQPPGAHCDVEFGLKNSDFAVAVTEPTPFGAHDLKRILDLAKILDKDVYVVLNRYNLADYTEKIMDIVEKYGSPLLGKIPLDQKIMESYAQGIPFLEYQDVPDGNESKKAIEHIAAEVKDIADEYKGGEQ
ncbi:MAG: P-loop NTPase [Candidatus Lokiarchaeota archaeon]|nr:P-loop NTPase [Candidatus Lokiarchaeota archaeon]